MKTMTCKQLGGICDKEFTAATFEDIAALSKEHGLEMWEKRDLAHMHVMEEMLALSKDPDALVEWFENKRKEFDALPENPSYH